MNARTIMILGAGPLQVPAVSVAQRLGLRVVAVDGSSSAPGLKFADKAIVAEISDFDTCREIALTERVSGVIQICSEVSIPVIGRLNAEFGWSGLSPAASVAATNKARMRESFARYGAPSPVSFHVSDAMTAMLAVQKIGGPAIVKPSRSSGSRGVSTLSCGALREDVFTAFSNAQSFSADRGVVVEEFVDGPEFSVEILAWSGARHVLAVTDKLTTGAPHFVEVGHTQPSRLSDVERKKVCDTAIAGVDALGIDWSAVHAEVKLAKTGPMLIEIGARMGGDFITTELVPRSTGIDMLAGAISLAMGDIPDLGPKHAPRGAAIRYLMPPPGRVLQIQGKDLARRSPGVAVVDIYIKEGSIVQPVTSSGCRSGHVIAEGTDAVDAASNAEMALHYINVVNS